MNEYLDFRWCLVGNIVRKHLFGENKEIRLGSKQFNPESKVYIFPKFGGFGHEKIIVIGYPRVRKKLIEVIIKTNLIKNVRLKKVYSPFIKEKISKNLYYQNWEKSIDEIKELQNFANFINSLSREVT
ncbi:MAG: hypothetical protein U0457_05055 [Candidatus Sericytochromatia bacterium]